MTVSATRMNLLRARRRLEQVSRGTALLRRKREALVTELFQLARRAVDTRQRITERAAEAYPALLGALGRHGRSGLLPLGWPLREVEVEIEGRQVWGIAVADILERPTLRRSVAARGAAPGSAGPAATVVAERFEELMELVLEAAAREVLIRRLGEALAKTSRQVNMLEQRIGPGLNSQITSVQRVLDEREREEHGRLRRLVKSRGKVARSTARTR